MAAAPAPAATQGGDAAPKKKKGKLVLVIAIVAILGAGGGAAWFFMKKPADGAKAEVAHTPVFLPLEPFTVNLRDETSERYLQVGVNLELKSEPDSEKLKAQLPAVRSRILLLLSSQKSGQLLTIEDKQRLGEQIIAEVKLVPALKDVPVHAVHFSAFVIQ